MSGSRNGNDCCHITQKAKLLQFETWKTDIGLPAIEENERIRVLVSELQQSQITSDAEMDALNQENQALQIQIAALEEQVGVLCLQTLRFLIISPNHFMFVDCIM